MSMITNGGPNRGSAAYRKAASLDFRAVWYRSFVPRDCRGLFVVPGQQRHSPA